MNILITGGASNIAYKVAIKLSQNNRVYLTTHTDSQLGVLKGKINKNITCFKLDVTNTKDYKKLDDIDLDIFVSCAALGHGGSLLGMDIKVLRENYEVNVFSSLELMKYVFSKMQKNGGKIFIMSSLASMLPIVMLESYTSSKAALSLIILTLQKELKMINSNVKLSLIELGAFYTGFNQVMIDNKENNLDKNSIFYKYRDKFDKRQRLIFNIIESKNIDKVANKIVKEVYKKKPKKIIRIPFSQVVMIKLYLILFR